MPIPKPEKNEKQADFIKRCVTDKVMETEYKKKDQRLAICYNQWRNHRN